MTLFQKNVLSTRIRIKNPYFLSITHKPSETIKHTSKNYQGFGKFFIQSGVIVSVF